MPNFFATSAKGIESVTAEELKAIGASAVEATPGGVHFEGDLGVLYKANLWVRTATRILMPMREFAAKTPEMLYDQVRRLKWEQYLNPEKTFAVDCTIAGSRAMREAAALQQSDESATRVDERGSGSRPPRRGEGHAVSEGITHSRYASLKIKDAIVDQLRMKQGARPNVDTDNPDLRVFAYLNGGRCTLSLDASGHSLHERGYRLKNTGAPLRETLAAAIVLLSGWNAKTPFVDPMCGAGTLALEAALIGLDIAPGLFRERFGFFGWPDFDEKLWQRTLDDARARAKKRVEAPIVGYDRDREAVAAALENAKRAGLVRMVHFEKREIQHLEPIGHVPGTLIVNPPYGERLGDVEELKPLYGMLGDLFKQRMKGYTAWIFTGNMELAKSVGLKASRRIELYNGPIECRLLKYEMY